LIKKFYDVMEECPEEVIDNRLVTGFDRIVQAYKNDPVELAAQIHMLIVDIHPFLDGNGRTARTFLNSILQSAGLPMAVFPHKKEYKDIVQEARDKKDYSIFGKYVNELTSENKYGELKEVCKYLHENNCHKLESQPKPRKDYEICFNYMLKKQQEAEHSKHLKAYRQDKGTRLREVRKKK